jgi:hypothetical protein
MGYPRKELSEIKKNKMKDSPLKEHLKGWMTTICFDIDGTLFDYKEQPREKIIAMAKSLLQDSNNRVFFWSGGGVEYAQMRCRRVGLPEDRVIPKGSFQPDIAIDDQEVNLGFNNLRIQ